MLHKFLLSLTAVWAAHCVGSHNTAPSPSPFPLFSPMGRLLSSWPAHGEKRGKGEGDGALVVLCAQNSFLRVAPHPNAFLFPFSNSAAQTVVTGFSDKTMAGFCTFFQLTLTLVWAPHCVGSHKTLPHPLPPFPFSHPWAGC